MGCKFWHETNFGLEPPTVDVIVMLVRKTQIKNIANTLRCLLNVVESCGI